VNRARGLLARLRSSLRPEEHVSDDVLVERVRAALGHACTHAGAIEVTTREGAVMLRGPVLDREHRRVLRSVGRVRGVRSIESELQPHVAPTNVPGLQDSMPMAGWVRPRATRCGQIMKRDVQTVGERDAVQRAADLMALANVGFLPVCDQRRRVVGTITDRDIVVRVVAKGVSPASWVVGDVMSRKVVACRPEDELEIAEQFMAQYQVARLPITDEDGTLQGVISLSDIAEHEPLRRTGRTLRAVASREAPPSEKN
jgi:CBS domain-containing protein